MGDDWKESRESSHTTALSNQNGDGGGRRVWREKLWSNLPVCSAAQQISALPSRCTGSELSGAGVSCSRATQRGNLPDAFWQRGQQDGARQDGSAFFCYKSIERAQRAAVHGEGLGKFPFRTREKLNTLCYQASLKGRHRPQASMGSLPVVV